MTRADVQALALARGSRMGSSSNRAGQGSDGLPVEKRRAAWRVDRGQHLGIRGPPPLTGLRSTACVCPRLPRSWADLKLRADRLALLRRRQHEAQGQGQAAQRAGPGAAAAVAEAAGEGGKGTQEQLLGAVKQDEGGEGRRAALAPVPAAPTSKQDCASAHSDMPGRRVGWRCCHLPAGQAAEPGARAAGSSGKYVLPRGFLYEYVSCPNYLGGQGPRGGRTCLAAWVVPICTPDACQRA